MNALIVHAHPHQESFNYAIVAEIEDKLVAKNYEVKIVNVYDLDMPLYLTNEEYKNMATPVSSSTVQKQQALITAADLLVFVYPVWWGSMPGLLHGYFEKFYTINFACKFDDHGHNIGLLHDKKAIIIDTLASPENQAQSSCVLKSLSNNLDFCILKFCGVEVLAHKHFGSLHSIEDYARRSILEDINNLFEVLA